MICLHILYSSTFSLTGILFFSYMYFSLLYLFRTVSILGEKIIIRLEMEARNLEPAMSRNTIGELQGTQNPNK